MRSLLLGLLAAAAASLAYGALFSDHGYGVYRAEQRELERLESEIEKLKRERERLAREVLRLRNDPHALEELIHRELGYVYPDEYMLIMPEEGEERGVGSEGSGD